LDAAKIHAALRDLVHVFEGLAANAEGIMAGWRALSTRNARMRLYGAALLKRFSGGDPRRAEALVAQAAACSPGYRSAAFRGHCWPLKCWAIHTRSMPVRLLQHLCCEHGGGGSMLESEGDETPCEQWAQVGVTVRWTKAACDLGRADLLRKRTGKCRARATEYAGGRSAHKGPCAHEEACESPHA
jgi:hypothetical protein